MQERSDQQLLRAFAAQGSEEAFAELARRHASLVYATAKRKLSDAAWAEEVAQLVFVALARKAPFLCHHQNLSAWLHHTTSLECRNFLRTELRRRRREEIAMNLNQTPANDPELAAQIDEALLELSEKDRQ